MTAELGKEQKGTFHENITVLTEVTMGPVKMCVESKM
jgi:hypothetical protein